MAQAALSTYGARYTAKKASFSFLGASFRIFGPDGRLQFCVKQKAFKLKEITVFADEASTKPMLTIMLRSLVDSSPRYDVTDVATGQRVGAMKRVSFLPDKWIILGEGDKQVGEVLANSTALALLRSFLSNLFPESFHVNVGGKQVGTIAQSNNPFILKYQVDFSQAGQLLDPRMGVAMVVVLLWWER